MTSLTTKYRVIDTDAHVIEPPDLWTSRMPAATADRIPRVEHHEGWGMDRWIVDGRWLNPVSYYNVAGWREHTPSHPLTLEEADPAGVDPHARLQRMDEYGLHAQVLYPNIIGFDSHAFYRMDDPALALECVRVYNDFLTEFASADPERLLPIAMLPFWDVEACLAEMERTHEMGHRGILWAAKLHTLGFPRVNSPHWDPVYALAQEMGTSVNLHIGVGAYDEDNANFKETNHDVFHVGAYVVESAVGFSGNAHTIATLLVSDVFEKFRELKVVSVESGFGYLPYLLESLDWQWRNAGGLLRHPDRRMPSEKFFTNVYGTFWFESASLKLLEIYPEYADRLMFETDFPHPTSLTPGPASASDPPAEIIDRNFGSVDEEITRKVLQDTAARLYRVAI